MCITQPKLKNEQTYIIIYALNLEYQFQHKLLLGIFHLAEDRVIDYSEALQSQFIWTNSSRGRSYLFDFFIHIRLIHYYIVWNLHGNFKKDKSMRKRNRQ